MHPLQPLEPRLRHLLPAMLYADVWMEPTLPSLQRVFDHLSRLLVTLYGYAPRHVSENPPEPGTTRASWEEGTLLFTDLAGFSRLVEANGRRGRAGAVTLLGVLNAYLDRVIDVLQQAGGLLLEFTGDALLAEFRADERQLDTARAVRAALRMQRAMAEFRRLETPHGTYALGMRVGVHRGRFLAADIGTPLRMEHVLLGETIRRTKLAEGAGQVGRVCLTAAAHERVADAFRFDAHGDGHRLVVDDLTDGQLGELDLVLSRRKLTRPILADRSEQGMLQAIEATLRTVEPLAGFLPAAIVNLLVEQTQTTQDFPRPTVLFVSLVGLAESVDRARPDEIDPIVETFAHLFGRINGAVEARGGVLKKVTYHATGSDIVVYFGVPNAHTDDPVRAARSALDIRDIVAAEAAPEVAGRAIDLRCHMGLARGLTFAAEMGKAHGRREFNVLGPPVNLAARLMDHAGKLGGSGEILLSEPVRKAIGRRFRCEPLRAVQFKGGSAPTAIFALDALEAP